MEANKPLLASLNPVTVPGKTRDQNTEHHRRASHNSPDDFVIEVLEVQQRAVEQVNCVPQ